MLTSRAGTNDHRRHDELSRLLADNYKELSGFDYSAWQGKEPRFKEKYNGGKSEKPHFNKNEALAFLKTIGAFSEVDKSLRFTPSTLKLNSLTHPDQFDELLYLAINGDPLAQIALGIFLIDNGVNKKSQGMRQLGSGFIRHAIQKIDSPSIQAMADTALQNLLLKIKNAGSFQAMEIVEKEVYGIDKVTRPMVIQFLDHIHPVNPNNAPFKIVPGNWSQAWLPADDVYQQPLLLIERMLLENETRLASDLTRLASDLLALDLERENDRFNLKDEVTVQKWLVENFGQDKEDARQYVSILSEQPELKTQLMWLALNKSAAAQYILSCSYNTNPTSQANKTLEIYWVKMAAAQGHELAQLRLIHLLETVYVPQSQEISELYNIFSTSESEKVQKKLKILRAKDRNLDIKFRAVENNHVYIKKLNAINYALTSKRVGSPDDKEHFWVLQEKETALEEEYKRYVKNYTEQNLELQRLIATQNQQMYVKIKEMQLKETKQNIDDLEFRVAKAIFTKYQQNLYSAVEEISKVAKRMNARNEGAERTKSISSPVYDFLILLWKKTCSKNVITDWEGPLSTVFNQGFSAVPQDFGRADNRIKYRYEDEDYALRLSALIIHYVNALQKFVTLTKQNSRTTTKETIEKVKEIEDQLLQYLGAKFEQHPLSPLTLQELETFDKLVTEYSRKVDRLEPQPAIDPILNALDRFLNDGVERIISVELKPDKTYDVKKGFIKELLKNPDFMPDEILTLGKLLNLSAQEVRDILCDENEFITLLKKMDKEKLSKILKQISQWDEKKEELYKDNLEKFVQPLLVELKKVTKEYADFSQNSLSRNVAYQKVRAINDNLFHKRIQKKNENEVATSQPKTSLFGRAFSTVTQRIETTRLYEQQQLKNLTAYEIENDIIISGYQAVNEAQKNLKALDEQQLNLRTEIQKLVTNYFSMFFISYFSKQVQELKPIIMNIGSILGIQLQLAVDLGEQLKKLDGKKLADAKHLVEQAKKYVLYENEGNNKLIWEIISTLTKTNIKFKKITREYLPVQKRIIEDVYALFGFQVKKDQYYSNLIADEENLQVVPILQNKSKEELEEISRQLTSIHDEIDEKKSTYLAGRNKVSGQLTEYLRIRDMYEALSVHEYQDEFTNQASLKIIENIDQLKRFSHEYDTKVDLSKTSPVSILVGCDIYEKDIDALVTAYQRVNDEFNRQVKELSEHYAAMALNAGLLLLEEVKKFEQLLPKIQDAKKFSAIKAKAEKLEKDIAFIKFSASATASESSIKKINEKIEEVKKLYSECETFLEQDVVEQQVLKEKMEHQLLSGKKIAADDTLLQPCARFIEKLKFMNQEISNQDKKEITETPLSKVITSFDSQLQGLRGKIAGATSENIGPLLYEAEQLVSNVKRQFEEVVQLSVRTLATKHQSQMEQLIDAAQRAGKMLDQNETVTKALNTFEQKLIVQGQSVDKQKPVLRESLLINDDKLEAFRTMWIAFVENYQTVNNVLQDEQVKYESLAEERKREESARLEKVEGEIRALRQKVTELNNALGTFNDVVTQCEEIKQHSTFTTLTSECDTAISKARLPLEEGKNSAFTTVNFSENKVRKDVNVVEKQAQLQRLHDLITYVDQATAKVDENSGKIKQLQEDVRENAAQRFAPFTQSLERLRSQLDNENCKIYNSQQAKEYGEKINELLMRAVTTLEELNTRNIDAANLERDIKLFVTNAEKNAGTLISAIDLVKLSTENFNSAVQNFEDAVSKAVQLKVELNVEAQHQETTRITNALVTVETIKSAVAVSQLGNDMNKHVSKLNDETTKIKLQIKTNLQAKFSKAVAEYNERLSEVSSLSETGELSSICRDKVIALQKLLDLTTPLTSKITLESVVDKVNSQDSKTIAQLESDLMLAIQNATTAFNSEISADQLAKHQLAETRLIDELEQKKSMYTGRFNLLVELKQSDETDQLQKTYEDKLAEYSKQLQLNPLDEQHLSRLEIYRQAIQYVSQQTEAINGLIVTRSHEKAAREVMEALALKQISLQTQLERLLGGAVLADVPMIDATKNNFIKTISHEVLTDTSNIDTLVDQFSEIVSNKIIKVVENLIKDTEARIENQNIEIVRLLDQWPTEEDTESTKPQSEKSILMRDYQDHELACKQAKSLQRARDLEEAGVNLARRIKEKNSEVVDKMRDEAKALLREAINSEALSLSDSYREKLGGAASPVAVTIEELKEAHSNLEKVQLADIDTKDKRDSFVEQFRSAVETQILREIDNNIQSIRNNLTIKNQEISDLLERLPKDENESESLTKNEIAELRIKYEAHLVDCANAHSLQECQNVIESANNLKSEIEEKNKSLLDLLLENAREELEDALNQKEEELNQLLETKLGGANSPVTLTISDLKPQFSDLKKKTLDEIGDSKKRAQYVQEFEAAVETQILRKVNEAIEQARSQLETTNGEIAPLVNGLVPLTEPSENQESQSQSLSTRSKSDIRKQYEALVNGSASAKSLQEIANQQGIALNFKAKTKQAVMAELSRCLDDEEIMLHQSYATKVDGGAFTPAITMEAIRKEVLRSIQLINEINTENKRNEYVTTFRNRVTKEILDQVETTISDTARSVEQTNARISELIDKFVEQDNETEALDKEYKTHIENGTSRTSLSVVQKQLETANNLEQRVKNKSTRLQDKKLAEAREQVLDGLEAKKSKLSYILADLLGGAEFHTEQTIEDIFAEFAQLEGKTLQDIGTPVGQKALLDEFQTAVDTRILEAVDKEIKIIQEDVEEKDQLNNLLLTNLPESEQVAELRKQYESNSTQFQNARTLKDYKDKQASTTKICDQVKVVVQEEVVKVLDEEAEKQRQIMSQKLGEAVWTGISIEDIKQKLLRSLSMEQVEDKDKRAQCAKLFEKQVRTEVFNEIDRVNKEVKQEVSSIHEEILPVVTEELSDDEEIQKEHKEFLKQCQNAKSLQAVQDLTTPALKLAQKATKKAQAKVVKELETEEKRLEKALLELIGNSEGIDQSDPVAKTVAVITQQASAALNRNKQKFTAKDQIDTHEKRKGCVRQFTEAVTQEVLLKVTTKINQDKKRLNVQNTEIETMLSSLEPDEDVTTLKEKFATHQSNHKAADTLQKVLTLEQATEKLKQEVNQKAQAQILQALDKEERKFEEELTRLMGHSSERGSAQIKQIKERYAAPGHIATHQQRQACLTQFKEAVTEHVLEKVKVSIEAKRKVLNTHISEMAGKLSLIYPDQSSPPSDPVVKDLVDKFLAHQESCEEADSLQKVLDLKEVALALEQKINDKVQATLHEQAKAKLAEALAKEQLVLQKALDDKLGGAAWPKTIKEIMERIKAAKNARISIDQIEGCVEEFRAAVEREILQEVDKEIRRVELRLVARCETNRRLIEKYPNIRTNTVSVPPEREAEKPPTLHEIQSLRKSARAVTKELNAQVDKLGDVAILSSGFAAQAISAVQQIKANPEADSQLGNLVTNLRKDFTDVNDLIKHFNKILEEAKTPAPSRMERFVVGVLFPIKKRIWGLSAEDLQRIDKFDTAQKTNKLIPQLKGMLTEQVDVVRRSQLEREEERKQAQLQKKQEAAARKKEEQLRKQKLEVEEQKRLQEEERKQKQVEEEKRQKQLAEEQQKQPKAEDQSKNRESFKIVKKSDFLNLAQKHLEQFIRLHHRAGQQAYDIQGLYLDNALEMHGENLRAKELHQSISEKYIDRFRDIEKRAQALEEKLTNQIIKPLTNRNLYVNTAKEFKKGTKEYKTMEDIRQELLTSYTLLQIEMGKLIREFFYGPLSNSARNAFDTQFKREIEECIRESKSV